MAQKQVFVQQVAFMEGLKYVTPAPETRPATLANVHARVCALEKLLSQPQPPPTAAPDWESLRYRTNRLWRTPSPAPASTPSLGIVSYSAAEVGVKAEKEGGGGGDVSVGDDDDDGKKACGDGAGSDQFDRAAQDFCRLAGKHRYQPMRPIQTMREFYAAAFEFSLVLEGKPASPVQYPPPPGYNPPSIHSHPGMLPMGRPSAPPPPPRIIRVEKKRPKKKAPKKGGFLRLMACGRGDDSDSDSYSGSDSDDESVRARRGGGACCRAGCRRVARRSAAAATTRTPAVAAAPWLISHCKAFG
ncbi:hypothetical protein PG997_005397 [Apiospora hydei]|uniref:Uncharacterized protein n=1 Tax=Apiospora hydei TaxID=1337664 RepID=A0ABR1X4U5_9PEZI